MQTLQSDDRAIESHMAYSREPAASTSTCYSTSIPCFPEQSKANQYNSYNCGPYPTSKKRVLRLKKVYSTRARGRSGALHSLARKLERFKVRTVVVEETAAEECKQNR